MATASTATQELSEGAPAQEPALLKGLGPWDATLVTIGSILGTGIFITTGDMARVLPHPGLLLLAWLAGGLLTIAGALTYAELGALFPRAGGQYHFLKEAYGSFYGFLFGWVSFLVIMSGGIATLAAGFGEYLGSFLPFFSTSNRLIEVSLGAIHWSLNGGQIAGAAAIVFLSAVNYSGLREGTLTQNLLTAIKIGSIVGLAAVALALPAPVAPRLLSPLPSGGFLSAFGVAMIAVLWSFDGWYGATNLAGEMRRPQRDLPVGLIGGTVAVTLLYLAMNLLYVRTLPVTEMGASGRIGEEAARVLLGPSGARIVSLAVLLSTFGCLSATILYCCRIYLPMARDGLFFPALARIHPQYRTPSSSIVAQAVWSVVLVFSGSYEQLYTYVMFAVVLFHAATGAAVVTLRRRRPEVPRPYRAWGYPWVTGIFVISSSALVLNTFVERPAESSIGLVILVLGVPAYLYWSRASNRRPNTEHSRELKQ